jgi:hypothetical protein
MAARLFAVTTAEATDGALCSSVSQEARLMTRGLTLKCVQCDSQEFHILYEMGSVPGGVPRPRASGSYECVQCGHVADAAAQEAMLVNIQQAREADAQGVKDDPEP